MIAPNFWAHLVHLYIVLTTAPLLLPFLLIWYTACDHFTFRTMRDTDSYLLFGA